METGIPETETGTSQHTCHMVKNEKVLLTPQAGSCGVSFDYMKKNSVRSDRGSEP